MTVLNLKNCKGPEIVQALSKVCGLHTAHGFTLKLAVMDGKFAPHELEINKLSICLNMMAASKHIPKIELLGIEDLFHVYFSCFCVNASVTCLDVCRAYILIAL